MTLLKIVYKLIGNALVINTVIHKVKAKGLANKQFILYIYCFLFALCVQYVLF